MKKSTKFVSLLLAVMLTVSTFAGIAVFPVSAGEGGEQRVYFRFPDESVWTHEGLKNNVRSGKANVYCYAYAIYGNSKPYALGWKTRTTQCNFVADDPTLYYFDLNGLEDKGPIEDGADYGIIFSTAAAGQNQTCDLNLSTECIGDTVIVTPFNGVVDRENAADSNKRDHYAAWLNHSDPYGPKATISSLGALMPGYFPANQPHAQQLSNSLKQYLTNPKNNSYFQYENNMKLCEALKVTPQEVYDQYLADNKDNIKGEPETDASVPCPFYRYMYINDQEKEVEGKLAAPEYVKEVLGITDEEPTTTEEPTTVKPDEPVSTVTVTADATINVGSEVPGSQKFSYPDAGYGISNLSFSDFGTDFEYGAEYQLNFMVEANEGYVLTEDTEVNLVVGDDSIAPYSMDKEFNQDGTITAHFFFKMPEAPTTVEPTTEPAPADVFTVAGSSDAIFNGTSWDASNEANDMTFNEATGLYEITYSNVQPEDAIQLKVVKNHGWDESYPEQNVSFNVKSVCDVKVTYNPETNEVKVEGEGVTFDDDLKPYSIIAVGNGEDTYLNGAGWDPCDPANAMTEVADGIWEMTMEDIYAFDNYQIKFAVNSVDEEGNPTSNPWAHNFGSEEETQYPVNTELDAFYNGKNCIFEVEEDGSTVKLQLDLRNFDFSTKTGAKMTITVTAPEPEPTTEPTTEPVITEEPTTEPVATEEPTTEPVATEEPTTEPVAASTYTVAGSSDAIFNGTSWDASNEANDMTFNEATGLYEITYSNVQPEDAIQLKVVKNHGWDESYPEQNVSFNVKSVCDVKVTYNPETNEVKVEGEGVTFDDDLKPYSIIAVGNGEDTYLNGAGWDPCDPANAMTEVADGIWEMTMEDIYAFDNYQIKFAVNSVDEEGNPTSNPWAHNFGSEEETQYPVNTELDAFYNGKNCIFEVEEDGSTVKLQLDLRNFDFSTKTGAKMTITVTAPEPEPTTEPTTEPVATEEPTTEPVATEEPTTEPVAASTYTVAGSSDAIFNGTSWDASNEANDMTFNEATGLYEITYSNVQPEDAIQLKVVKNHGWDESYPEQNVSFNVKSVCDVKVTYNPETNEVKVEGEGVTFDDDLKPYSIIAVGNGEDTYLNGAGWDPCDPANAMTEVADGIWEMTMEDIYAFDNYQIKFAVNSVDEEGNPTSNPWAHNFGSEEETQYPVNTELDAFYNGKNCIFEVEEDGSTVKLQLDLRNFDFSTKTGAKMTITVTAPEPQAEGTIGDVNKDGQVDAIDAMLIQQVAIGKTPNSIFSNKLADVNNDGIINVLDASCVQRYAAGMTKKTGNAGVAYEDITPVSDDPQIME